MHNNIIGLFEKSVSQRPEKTCIIENDTHHTYRQINEYALKVACGLQKMGVHQHDTVILNFSKQLHYIITILALFKLDCCYIPIDDSYPEQYVSHIINCTGATHLVFDQSHEYNGPHQIKLHHIDDVIADSEPLKIIDYSNNSKAYIIFTSGTTGEPKGVIIEQSNLINLINNSSKVFCFREDDQFILVHSFCFDFSVWEMWVSLAYGGTLTLFDSSQHNIDRLTENIITNNITVLNATPSLFEKLINLPNQTHPSLRMVILGGETCYPARLKEWYHNNPSVDIYNCYGITETTVHVTYHKLEESDFQSGLSVIGNALPGYNITILEGELYVAGAGVCRGYTNTDHNQSAFSYKVIDGMIRRCFKTGDFADFDGNNIVFQSRNQDHAKVRGYRININAIDHQLSFINEINTSKTYISNTQLRSAIIISQQHAPCLKRQIDSSNEPSIFKLKNGLSIHRYNQEIQFSYHEIFESDTYFKHAPKLDKNAVIIDVGANIGLFSIACRLLQKHARIYALEPIPAIHEILQKNATLYDYECFCYGLDRHRCTQSMNFYPEISLISSLTHKQHYNINHIKSLLQEKYHNYDPDNIDKLYESISHSQLVDCQFLSLSNFIEEQSINNIDWIKIDAEAAEIDIFKGLLPEHINRIRYISVETDHDNKSPMLALLKEYGFNIENISESRYGKESFYMIHASGNFNKNTVIVNYLKQLQQPTYQYSQTSFKQYLLDSLKKTLPGYMIPDMIELIPTSQLSKNGKFIAPDKIDTASLPTKNKHLRKQLTDIFKQVLATHDIDDEKSFFDQGGNSLLLINLHEKLSCAFDLGKQFSLIQLLQYPSIAALEKYLTPCLTISEPTHDSNKHSAHHNHNVAIIGISGRFPNADNVDALWDNLMLNTDLITRSSTSYSLDQDQYLPNCCGLLDNIEYFDAGFFNISNKDASMTDPQHRLLLEESYNVFRNAGYAPSKIGSHTGVFVGTGKSRYDTEAHNNHHDINYELRNDIATEKDYVATKISYALNLKGPSININTACSTALISIITACKSLSSYECDYAIAGGSFVVIPDKTNTIKINKNSTFSKTGVCRPFDAHADGLVAGSAAGVVLLKRLSDALNDKDTILGVIEGYAINNDGHDKLAFTAPSIRGQMNCIKQALNHAGLQPHDIDYIECHGTATNLGDEAELTALKQVFSPHPITIGSIKSNLGHCDAASGFAGICKALMIFNKKVIPVMPTLNKPCPALQSSSLKVNLEPIHYDVTKKLRIGISSFGIGGSNAHLIVTSHQSSQPCKYNQLQKAHIFPFSAKSQEALTEMINQNKQWLQLKAIDLRNYSLTLMHSTDNFNVRCAFIASNQKELLFLMEQYHPIKYCYSDSCHPDLTYQAQLWIAKDHEWQAETEPFIRQPLPAYPFQRQYFWNNTTGENQNSYAQSSSIITSLTLTEIKNFLIQSFYHITEHHEINENSDFFEIGGDSFGCLTLITLIEENFHIDIDIDSIYQLRSVKKLANKLHRLQQQITKSNNPIKLKCTQQSNNTVALIFINQVNGSSYCYEDIIQGISAPINIYTCANTNYHVDKEPTNLNKMAHHYTTLIDTLVERYIIFCGWSYAGNLSYKISHQLSRKNILGIILIDSWATYNQQYNNKHHFKQLLERQHQEKSANQYIDQWNEMLWRRAYTILNDCPHYSSTPLYLLKASDLLMEYIEIENPNNNWHLFNSNISVSTIKSHHINIIEKVSTVTDSINAILKQTLTKLTSIKEEKI